MIFTNGTMQLQLLKMDGKAYSNGENVALFRRLGDNLYITCRNVNIYGNCQCTWDWGHYFVPIESAMLDYAERKKLMNEW